MVNVLIALMIIMFPCDSISAPSISSVSGDIRNGQFVTISGSGFGGSGPSIEIYDEFEGTNGADVGLSATVGTWSGYGTYKPRYLNAVHNSGTTSASMIDRPTSDFFGQLRKTFSTPTTSIYVSYWMMVPPGKFFPGATEAGSWATSTGGNLKPVWLMDGSAGYNTDNNLVVPNWTGGGWQLAFSNNDAVNMWGDSTFSAGAWWSWGTWNHVELWLQAGAAPDADAGSYYLRITNGATSTVVSKATDYNGVPAPLFTDGLGNDIPQYDRIHIPGVSYNRVEGTDIAYDDVYVATGPHAAARVMVGNASTIENCTYLTVATVDEWNDTTISSTIRGGAFEEGDEVYLFVIDSSNTASVGIGPYTFGASRGKRYYLSIAND